jgi:hypothetical protein
MDQGRSISGEVWAGMSVTERVRRCLDAVCDGTTASPDDVHGLDDNVIGVIDKDQPGAISGAYRCFLESAGGGAGRFLQGSDVFHPQVIGLRAAAQELLDGTGLELRAEDRVILMHQGSQFDFLRGLGEDPEVWSYCEGSVPRRSHARFTEWLRDNADEQTRAWAQLTPLGAYDL